MRSSVSSCAWVNRNRSAGSAISSRSSSCCRIFGPTPSMLSASREAKWIRRSRICAGHTAPPVHRDDRLAGLPFDRRAAHRAARRHRELALRAGALLREHADDLGNDLPGAPHDDRVADAHVLAPQLVLVVQGRAPHDHAGHAHGLQFGHRRERAGAPDLHRDVLRPASPPLPRETCTRSPTAAPDSSCRAPPAGRASPTFTTTPSVPYGRSARRVVQSAT